MGNRRVLNLAAEVENLGIREVRRRKAPSCQDEFVAPSVGGAVGVRGLGQVPTGGRRPGVHVEVRRAAGVGRPAGGGGGLLQRVQLQLRRRHGADLFSCVRRLFEFSLPDIEYYP